MGPQNSISDQEKELLQALKLACDLIVALLDLMENVTSTDRPMIAPSRLATVPTNCKPKFRNGGDHAAQH